MARMPRDPRPDLEQGPLLTASFTVTRVMLHVEDSWETSGESCVITGEKSAKDACGAEHHVLPYAAKPPALQWPSRLSARQHPRSDSIDSLQYFHPRSVRSSTPEKALRSQIRHEQEERQMSTTTPNNTMEARSWYLGHTSPIGNTPAVSLADALIGAAITITSGQATETELPPEILEAQATMDVPLTDLPTPVVTDRSGMCQDKWAGTKSAMDSFRNASSMCERLSWSPSTSASSPILIYPEHQQLPPTTKSTLLIRPKCMHVPMPRASPTPPTSPTPPASPKPPASLMSLAGGDVRDRLPGHINPVRLSKVRLCGELVQTPTSSLFMARAPTTLPARGSTAISNSCHKSQWPVNPTRETITTNTQRSGSDKSVLGEDETGPLTPSAEFYSVSSPLSAISSRGHHTSDDEEQGTPMTSAEPSPVRWKPPVKLPLLSRRTPLQLDEGLDVTVGTSSAATPLTIQLDGTSGQLDGVPGTSMAADSTRLSAIVSESDCSDTTPLTTPHPAKSATAFPFPRQSSIRNSFRRGAVQRRPSALLQYCELNSTPRQRRLLAGVPDRFVSARASTPTKETFVLSKPSDKLNSSDKRNRRLDNGADPFGPSPRRSLRMAERFTTLRHPIPPARSTGNTATLLDDAQARRSVSDGAVWSVGGTVVTEGVASTPNGRGGRVTSGTSAPHHIADFLRRTTPSEEEATHGRRLALAMDINQNARMLHYGSPAPVGSPLSAGSYGPLTPARRTWRDSVWQRDDTTTGEL